MQRKTQVLLLSVVLRTPCALSMGRPMNPKLWTYFPPPTSVLYAVCDLHLLVHLQTLSLTFCVGLLLLLLLALAVHHRGVHYYSGVRDCSGVWRCGVCHLVGGSRLHWGTPKMSHLSEKCKLSTRERPRHGEGRTEGGRLLAGLQVQMRQITNREVKYYRKLEIVAFKTNAIISHLEDTMWKVSLVQNGASSFSLINNNWYYGFLYSQTC